MIDFDAASQVVVLKRRLSPQRVLDGGEEARRGMVGEGSRALVHTAALADRPLIARKVSPHGTTTANLLVDGETVYVTDYFGVMAMTEDGTTQVVKDDFVSTLALDDNHDLIWEHVGVVSWFEDGVADVGIASVSHVEHLVASGDRIFASTRTVRTNGLVFGSLYRIDKPTRTAELIAHAPSFASEFDGVNAQFPTTAGLAGDSNCYIESDSWPLRTGNDVRNDHERFARYLLVGIPNTPGNLD